MIWKKMNAKIAVGAMAATASLLSATSPASAVHVRAEYGENYATSNGSNYGVLICDLEEDGRRAYAALALEDGRVVTVGDENGSQHGCTNRSFGSRISQMKICENRVLGDDPCSGWVVTG